MAQSYALFQLFKTLSQKDKKEFLKLIKGYKPASKRNPNEPYTDPIVYEEEGYEEFRKNELKTFEKARKIIEQMKREAKDKQDTLEK